jgi:pyridoxamine 5'-phosphate oxidase
MELNEIRKEYKKRELNDDSVKQDPMQQFGEWFEDALTSWIEDINAMTLATSTKSGKPSARMVLLKLFDNKGFVFYSNYNSRKAAELDENPYVSLVIWWKELERQVRIEGNVLKLSPADSDEYFQSRPFESKVSAAISPQSKVIPSRKHLEDLWLSYLKDHFPENISRPDFWGGYHVSPDKIEFWQGRPNRLHDRILYTREEQGWRIERLAP